jgi:hypothetical protein
MYVIVNRCLREKKKWEEDVFLFCKLRVVSASLSSFFDLRDGMVGKSLNKERLQVYDRAYELYVY